MQNLEYPHLKSVSDQASEAGRDISEWSTL